MPSLYPKTNIVDRIEYVRPQMMTLPDAFTPGEVLYNVYIRINTPLYSNGWQRPEDREAVDTEAKQIAAAAGFSALKSQYHVLEGNPNVWMYWHPHHISGVMPWDRVEALVQGVNNAKRCSLRWIDVYEPQEIVSDEEAALRLDHHTADLRENILERCKTKFRTQFVLPNFMAMVERFPGMSFPEGKRCIDIAPAVPQTVFTGLTALIDNLVAEGWLKTFKNDHGVTHYRTANKTEQRQEGLLKKAKAAKPAAKEQIAISV